MKNIKTANFTKNAQFFEIPQIIIIQVEFVKGEDVQDRFPDVHSGGKDIHVATLSPDQTDPSAQKILDEFGHIDGKALHVGAAVTNLITSIHINGHDSGLRITNDRIKIVRK